MLGPLHASWHDSPSADFAASRFFQFRLAQHKKTTLKCIFFAVLIFHRQRNLSLWSLGTKAFDLVLTGRCSLKCYPLEWRISVLSLKSSLRIQLHLTVAGLYRDTRGAESLQLWSYVGHTRRKVNDHRRGIYVMHKTKLKSSPSQQKERKIRDLGLKMWLCCAQKETPEKGGLTRMQTKFLDPLLERNTQERRLFFQAEVEITELHEALRWQTQLGSNTTVSRTCKKKQNKHLQQRYRYLTLFPTRTIRNNLYVIQVRWKSYSSLINSTLRSKFSSYIQTFSVLFLRI